MLANLLITQILTGMVLMLHPIDNPNAPPNNPPNGRPNEVPKADPPKIGPRPWVEVRGIYGGYGDEITKNGKTLADYGINAVWIGSGGLDRDRIQALKQQGIRVFAEFNTLHDAAYLKDHPDAAPVGPDGNVCPPPDGWQGVSPTHPGYRRYRMDAFRKALRDFPIDGIWLDYHHSHASWEQAEPNLPDTDFHPRTLAQFTKDTGIALPAGDAAAKAKFLLGPQRTAWTQWRCDVLTDWVRECDAIRKEVRPQALLGTFHCPWSDSDNNNALREKLAIDLKAQSQYIDVFSIMPYHARFGHAHDPAWITRQTAWLGQHLGVTGAADEKIRIWPIVQLSNWGENVPVAQITEILDAGTRPPARGVMAFVWGTLHPERDKVEAMGEFYRRASLSPNRP